MAGPGPYLITGLGNPGQQYEGTPHNVGFAVVDALMERWGKTEFRVKNQGLLAEHDFHGAKVFLLKPQTYMNLSGQSVGPLVHFYKLPLATHFLAISDDVDIPPGAVRIRGEGGSGGHNGLKSLIEALGTETFPRLRIGVGRNPQAGTADHVLKKIGKDQRKLYSETVEHCALAVEAFLDNGLEKAMSQFNRKAPVAPPDGGAVKP